MTTLVTIFVVGVLSIIALSVVLALLGVVLHVVVGLTAFLLFKVVPVLLIGWLVVRLLSRRQPAQAPVEDDILA